MYVTQKNQDLVVRDPHSNYWVYI